MDESIVDFKEIDQSESVGPSANRAVISDHDIGTETVLVTDAHNPWNVARYLTVDTLLRTHPTPRAPTSSPSTSLSVTPNSRSPHPIAPLV